MSYHAWIYLGIKAGSPIIIDTSVSYNYSCIEANTTAVVLDISLVLFCLLHYKIVCVDSLMMVLERL